MTRERLNPNDEKLAARKIPNSGFVIVSLFVIVVVLRHLQHHIPSCWRIVCFCSARA